MTHELSDEVRQVAWAIAGPTTHPGQDASGGHVGCLTEAVMGVTAGLVRIANAIELLAIAVSADKQTGDEPA